MNNNDKLDGGMPILSVQCTWCRNNNTTKDRVCKAFPFGIPDDIWLNETKHDHPIDGDNGIVYDSIV